MTTIAPCNRLGESLSPYLRQHANNPVHWQPWDDEALELAKTNDVPILLSIGYVACHWCHVMEKESFSDVKVAAMMNESFVCIKVDCEERPDLDKTYQLAHYLLSRQSGGWPLTAFLAHDHVPFFTGTYFPPVPRGKSQGFVEVLAKVRSVWENNKQQILEQNTNIAKALISIDESRADQRDLGSDVVDKCVRQLDESFDIENGGLGKAPKFPQAPALRLACHMISRDEISLSAGLVATLDAMAAGGLHDHLGGGFFRYCVDPLWDIPHFEKMLNNNAQLLELYASASVVLDSADYATVAHSTANWILDEMQLANGGFASSLDADSEGEEGTFYVWSREELTKELSKVELDILDMYTTSNQPANFEGNMIHIRLQQRVGFNKPNSELKAVFLKLKEVRSKRTALSIDDKVTVANCSLTAFALARAGLLLNEPKWIKAAHAVVYFVQKNLEVDGKLKTAWRDGVLSEIPAFLDDYAYFLHAKMELLQDTCNARAVKETTDLAKTILSMFDDKQGGLLFSAIDAPQTIRRTRTCDDGAVPAGNSVAALSFLKLGWLVGDTSLIEQAQKIIESFSWQLAEAPVHSSTLIMALDFVHQPQAVTVLTGEKKLQDDLFKKLVASTVKGHIVIKVDSNEKSLPDALVKPAPKDNKVSAYVCKSMSCHEAVDNAEDALSLIEKK